MEGVKTGDVLLFANNSATGFLLKTFTSSVWCHGGLAVRIKGDSHLPLTQRISLDGEGELHVLEINTGSRYDPISGEEEVGAAFSSLEWASRRYNVIAVRRLRDKLRQEDLRYRLADFISKYRGYRFTHTITPFIGVWLGIPLAGTEPRTSPPPGEMFCTELLAYFFNDCIGPELHRLTNSLYTGRLTEIFGEGAPDSACLYTPQHYTGAGSPHAIIFKGREEIVYEAQTDAVMVLLQPLLIGLAVMVILSMTLPPSKRQQ